MYCRNYFFTYRNYFLNYIKQLYNTYNYTKSYQLIPDWENLQTPQCMCIEVQCPSSVTFTSVVPTINGFCPLPSPLLYDTPVGEVGFFFHPAQYYHFLYICVLIYVPCSIITVVLICQYIHFHEMGPKNSCFTLRTRATSLKVSAM